ncbi:MAG: transcriptional activator RfaH [Roseovarius sp.]|nr:transcriptional activator RfaH [Roseovarius sp.]
MTNHHHGTAWFVAQFKPNSHRIAQRNLLRQGFETFLPQQEETRRARGRFVTRMRPLFPGYLFVSLDIAGTGLRAVNSTFGISRVVGSGTMPAAVPGDFIDALRRRCDDEDRLIPADEMETGDTITVTRGPFADFVGRIESIEADRRVWLLLEIAERQIRVAVPADHVLRA